MQNCLVLGAGVSGISAVELLLKKQMNVYIYDKDLQKLRELYENKIIDNRAKCVNRLNRKLLKNFDTIITSPGIFLSPKFVRECKLLDVNILGEIDLASMYCTAPIYAVTGTNGKTTTVNFLHQIFLLTNKKSKLLGNVGTPFCSEIENLNSRTKVVLEVSSFQLEYATHLRCKVSAILNFAPDHLDRYASFTEYKNTKSKILDCLDSSGVGLLNYDDERVRMCGESKKNTLYFSVNRLPNDVMGYYIDGKKVLLNTILGSRELFLLPQLKIKGRHNLFNLMCAIAMAHIAGVRPSQIQSVLPELTLPRHRIEFVGERDGVKFFNDSKATNIASTRVALDSFCEPTILLLGGSKKGEDFTNFLQNLPSSVREIVAFGPLGKQIFKKCKRLKVNCKYYLKLGSAFDYAKRIATCGDIVLLSPAGASYDEFKNFEERGEYFCNLVSEWIGEK